MASSTPISFSTSRNPHFINSNFYEDLKIDENDCSTSSNEHVCDAGRPSAIHASQPFNVESCRSNQQSLYVQNKLHTHTQSQFGVGQTIGEYHNTPSCNDRSSEWLMNIDSSDFPDDLCVSTRNVHEGEIALLCNYDDWKYENSGCDLNYQCSGIAEACPRYFQHLDSIGLIGTNQASSQCGRVISGFHFSSEMHQDNGAPGFNFYTPMPSANESSPYTQPIERKYFPDLSGGPEAANSFEFASSFHSSNENNGMDMLFPLVYPVLDPMESVPQDSLTSSDSHYQLQWSKGRNCNDKKIAYTNPHHFQPHEQHFIEEQVRQPSATTGADYHRCYNYESKNTVTQKSCFIANQYSSAMDMDIVSGSQLAAPLSDTHLGKNYTSSENVSVLAIPEPASSHRGLYTNNIAIPNERDDNTNGNFGIQNTNIPPLLPGLCSTWRANVKLLTGLRPCYWKNGRKNLQCFPTCPEHYDFFSMKINNRKHANVGVCRGPVYCQVTTEQTISDLNKMHNSDAKEHYSKEGIPYHQQIGMRKYENEGIYVLGRFERVPQRADTNLIDELTKPLTFTTATEFDAFRRESFQAVEMEDRRIVRSKPHYPSNYAIESCGNDRRAAFAKKETVLSHWYFLPDVWKVRPMLKKKRKATRSAPAQVFPFCFRVFVYVRDFDPSNYNGYCCIGTAESRFFELYSTRTVDRVKRSYHEGEQAASLQPVSPFSMVSFSEENVTIKLDKHHLAMRPEATASGIMLESRENTDSRKSTKISSCSNSTITKK